MDGPKHIFALSLISSSDKEEEKMRGVAKSIAVESFSFCFPSLSSQQLMLHFRHHLLKEHLDGDDEGRRQ